MQKRIDARNLFPINGSVSALALVINEPPQWSESIYGFEKEGGSIFTWTLFVRTKHEVCVVQDEGEREPGKSVDDCEQMPMIDS